MRQDEGAGANPRRARGGTPPSRDAADTAAQRANPLGDKVVNGVATVATDADLQTALTMKGLTRIDVTNVGGEGVNIRAASASNAPICIYGQVDAVAPAAGAMQVEEGGSIGVYLGGAPTSATVVEGGEITSVQGSGYVSVYRGGLVGEVDIEGQGSVKVNQEGKVGTVKQGEVDVDRGSVAIVEGGNVNVWGVSDDSVYGAITDGVKGGTVSLFDNAKAFGVSEGTIKVFGVSVSIVLDMGVEDSFIAGDEIATASGLEIQYADAANLMIYKAGNMNEPLFEK